MAAQKTKVDTAELMLLRLEHPDWTLQRLSEQFSVTRERIRQLLHLYMQQTHHELVSMQCVCKQCGKEYVIRGASALKSNVRRSFCSSECKSKWRVLELECAACGKPIYRKDYKVDANRKSHLFPGYHDSGLVFCNKSCYGFYFGKRAGFAAHPEHMRYRMPGSGQRYHFDRAAAYAEWESGVKPKELCQRYNIPRESLRQIMSYMKRKERQATSSSEPGETG